MVVGINRGFRQANFALGFSPTQQLDPELCSGVGLIQGHAPMDQADSEMFFFQVVVAVVSVVVVKVCFCFLYFLR